MKTAALDQIPDMIGTEVNRSDWFTIDQDRIDAFADATGDHQWIHVDEDRAAEGPFGTTIAHGFLTLSLLPHLASNGIVVPDGVAMAINYGTDKVRFLNPVVVGSRIRMISVLSGFDEKSPGRYLESTEVTVEIENEDTPAMVASTLTLLVMQPESPESEGT